MSMNPDRDANCPNISQEARQLANGVEVFGDLGNAGYVGYSQRLWRILPLADY